MRYRFLASIVSARWRLAAAVGLLLSVGLTGSAAAATLDFEGITTATIAPVRPGYGGLTWSSEFSVLNSATYHVQPSGYSYGTVSGNYVAFNSNGFDVAVTDGAFDFVGAYLTAAWNNDLQITVEGLLAGSLIYSQTITTDPYGPHWFTFDYTGIDELRFSSFGGTSAGFDGQGTHFAMDDFTSSVVPEPTTAALFGLGLAGLAAASRERRFARQP
jgi:hypothetical protein